MFLLNITNFQEMHKPKTCFQEWHITEDTKAQFLLKAEKINLGYL